MPDEVKFTEEEIKKLNSIQDGYVQMRGDFGQLHMSRIRVNTQLDDLNKLEEDLQKSFEKLQTDERSFLNETTEKYGQGTLNPETGVFISTEENTPDTPDTPDTSK